MESINIKSVIIQLIGFIGTGIYFLSYQYKDNKKLFRVQLISYVFYTLHLFLLGAKTGAICYVINLLRSFCLSSDYKILNSNNMCVAFCVAQLLAGVITWNGPISLLPVIANIASTIGGYSHNAKYIRIAGIFINSPLWIIYNVFVGSLAGVVDEIICEISMIISIVRYGWID